MIKQAVNLWYALFFFLGSWGVGVERHRDTGEFISSMLFLLGLTGNLVPTEQKCFLAIFVRKKS